ncbi:MAG: hypothetical protein DPW11_04675, partial [bacterium]|nr:hypothetical protein [bacterium]
QDTAIRGIGVDDGHGPVAQERVGLLFDTGKAKVEVDVHDIWLVWVESHILYIRIAVYQFSRELRDHGLTD